MQLLLNISLSPILLYDEHHYNLFDDSDTMDKLSIPTQFLQQTHYHPSWQTTLTQALEAMDSQYLQQLLYDELPAMEVCKDVRTKPPSPTTHHKSLSPWLPGIKNIFNAFSLPMNSVRYILLGESPYPRTESANGYAFWDQAVTDLWSKTGLSKAVNRATSLRNFIKMLLIASGDLYADNTQQTAIAAIDKTSFIQTNTELFQKLLAHGFLLLNASLTLEQRPVSLSSQQWLPFLKTILVALLNNKKLPTLILFGNIAKKAIENTKITLFPTIIAEHPYNVSFISNQDVIKLFKPFQLLRKGTGAS